MYPPWKESYNKLSMLKSRDVTLPTKIRRVKAIFFSSRHVQTWELDHNEGWALKNGRFELWCWRRLLRVPWTARKSNQSILEEINPEYSLEGLMLKLRLNSLGHWCEEQTHWKDYHLKGEGEWLDFKKMAEVLIHILIYALIRWRAFGLLPFQAYFE